MTTSYRSRTEPGLYAELLDLRAALEAEYATYLRGKPWWTAPLDSPKYIRGRELSRQLGNLHLTIERARVEAGGPLHGGASA